MKQQIYLLKLTAIIIAFFGCQNKQKNSSPTILVDIQNTTGIDLQEISNLHSIVPLETTDDNYIKQIEQVFFVDSCILIWDSQINDIFIFSNKGKFLHRLGSKGQGPKEYINIEDVYVDYINENISILDNVKQAVITYDTQGRFLKSDKIPFFAYAFQPTQKGYWFLNYAQNKDRNMLIYMDKSTKQYTKGFIRSDYNLTLINTNNFIETTEGKILFHYPNENIIYSLDEDNMTQYLNIDFGKGGNPYTDINKKEYQDFVKRNKFIGGLNRVYIYKNHLFFSFSKFNGINMNVEQYRAYVSLSDLKVKVFDFDIKHSDEIVVSPLPDIVGLSKDKLVYMINPNILPPVLISKLNNTKAKHSINDFEINGDSNPILVIYSLNK